MFVRGPTKKGSPVRTAELSTKENKMLYGSFRTAFKYNSVPGTCASIFLTNHLNPEARSILSLMPKGRLTTMCSKRLSIHPTVTTSIDSTGPQERHPSTQMESTSKISRSVYRNSREPSC
ncbi:MAG: hypothetical protein Q9183_008090 [Haloplaca sp. 2 TL-2023]